MTRDFDAKRTGVNTKRHDQEPSVAPSMEMDELEVDASSKDIKQGDSTSVTKLVVDRFDVDDD